MSEPPFPKNKYRRTRSTMSAPFQSKFLLKLKEFSRSYLKDDQDNSHKDGLVQVDVEVKSAAGQTSGELTSVSTISALLESSIEAMKDLHSQVVITSKSLESNSLDQVFRPLTDHILLISQQNQTILFQQSRLIDSVGNLEKALARNSLCLNQVVPGYSNKNGTDTLLQEVRDLVSKLKGPDAQDVLGFDSRQGFVRMAGVQVESINPFDDRLQQSSPKVARLQSIFTVPPPRKPRKDTLVSAAMSSIAEEVDAAAAVVVEESLVRQSR